MNAEVDARTIPVFVYGTLRKGGSQHIRMARAEALGSGTISGVIYRMSWYPALICGGEERVRGELYLVSEQDIQALDEFEGESYRRIQVSVRLDTGEEQLAWVWEWTADLVERLPIAGGDWLASGLNPTE